MANLNIERVSKSYDGRFVVRDMSFDVRAGEIFGFVGSNGAGKTTTMRMIMKLLTPDSGTVYWDGKTVTGSVVANFGYMPEERGLYPKMTVAQHLIYLARLHGHSRSSATTGMREWTEQLGISQYHAREIDTLSLGNQQRVQLAAALVHEPQLLILDEPFSGLDPIGVDAMSEVLRQQAAKGVPVLFSSHQLDLVERLCDRVGVIRAGEMAAMGAVNELRGTAPRALRIDVDAPAGWQQQLATVTGVLSVERADEEGSAIVEVADEVRANDVLQSAMKAGEVREFRWQQPTLTQMFRTLVSGADDEPGVSGEPAVSADEETRAATGRSA